MASTYTSSEVIDSDWDESENEDEHEDIEDNVTSEFQVDPLAPKQVNVSALCLVARIGILKIPTIVHGALFSVISY